MTYGSTASFAGITLQSSYNSRLQPAEIRAFSPTATLLDLCYDFHSSRVQFGPNCFIQQNVGDNGNVFQVVNNLTSSRSRSFTYDALNRISTGQSSGSAWGETYTIDPWGNLTNIAGITGKTYYEPLNCPADTHNRLSTCFGYDIAGNVIQNGSANYVYDAENRLVWAGGYRYIYDGDGARAEKCAASSATAACPTSGTTGTLYFRGTGSDTLDETDLAGNAIEEYVYFNGQRIARRDIGTNAVHYYFSDHLGSHSVVENATGTTCEQDVDYYPYGGQQNDYCPVVAQHYKFTGKERDAESGNDYFGARYYASNMGRWIRPDQPFADQNPADPQSWNLYTYARNNPLRDVDTDGFKVLPAVVAQAKSQIAATVAAGGDTFTMVFLGIHSGADPGTGLAASTYTGDNIGEWSNEFGLGTLDTSSTGNTILLPNANGDASAFVGAANQDQIDTANAIGPLVSGAGLSLDTIGHSNGVNGQGAFAAGNPGIENSVVIAPNTSSTGTMSNIVNSSQNTTIIQSTNDSRLAMTPAKRSPSSWAKRFRKNKNVNVQQTDQRGHGAQCYAAEIHGQESPFVKGCE